MSPAPTRRQALFGTASFALISGLGGALVPDSAFACHRYKSPVDGGTGCGARKRDMANGLSGEEDSGSASQPQGGTSSNTDTPSDTGTSSGSGKPEVNGKTVRVSNAAQLRSALSSARAGHRIELANGTYSGSFQITSSGTKNDPILIEASSRLKAELRSKLRVRGNHVIVSGLSFQNAGVELRAANCRVTRCYFDNSGTAISVRGADNAEIDHNEVTRWGGKGIDIDPRYERRSGYRPHIYRNYLHDSNGKNDNAAINIGQQAGHHDEKINAVVEYNLCVNVPRYKAIFCKSSQNTIRYNTLINCQGLVNRHGYENKYISNYLEKTNDFIINDKKCVAEGNKLVNCKNGLRVMAGDITSSEVPKKTGGHPNAEGCQVINNDTDTIRVGAIYSDFDKIIPAIDTYLSGNTGRIVQEKQSGTRIASSSQSRAGSGARKLSTKDVGPWSK